jgi:hypothetical protein
MGRKGKALLYLTPDEQEYLNYLAGFGIKMEQMLLPGILFYFIYLFVVGSYSLLI